MLLPSTCLLVGALFLRHPSTIEDLGTIRKRLYNNVLVREDNSELYKPGGE
jgi:hypothetical protein